ncbi:late competence development ComFB family protein [Spirulina sp. CS-785/01]|uniref:late competence development ComFB family protein n=1 Tax=Spirulina sp. CS-785/01 TaxID=3021716 RepID=UPI0023302D20|nr:late competence development ComFB family protein [Spirulina sp. CS-785/01]MDB9312557.1 late competence development ComFB family protein [Spirulina sp. CS-785/01]
MTSHSQSRNSYHNVTEALAIEEIERQLAKLPVEVTQSINKTDAIAYALNRLPSMYATSQEGYDWQKKRAQESFTRLLAHAAKWGIKAAQRNQKYFSTPLPSPHPTEDQLQALRTVLGREDLDWENLVPVVEQSLRQARKTNVIYFPSPQSFAHHSS